MSEVTLKFASIIALIDFEAEVNARILYKNLTDLTVTALFTNAEVELAKTNYDAIVLNK
jgi:hypothetical protein